MGQYIGARYIPRFMGTHDLTQSYEGLDVVDNGMGTSYIAKQPVPAGTPLTNTTYWAVYGASSGAIINLQDQIDDIRAKTVFVVLEVTGITDITSILQGAYDNLAEGYTIVIPEGTYEISDYIETSRAVNLYCIGELKPVGTLNNTNKGVIHYDQVSNIDIKANIVNASYSSTCNGILLTGCSNVTIHDSVIDLAQIGYDGCGGVNIGANSHLIRIRDSYICAEYGVLVNDVDGVYDIVITGCEFEGQLKHGTSSHGDAIEFNTPTYGSSNITISDCYTHDFEYNTTYARIIAFGFANATNVIATNNHFKDCKVEAFHLENGCQDFVIDGNIIDNIVRGVNVQPPSENIIVTNNLIKCGANGTAYGIDSGWGIVFTAYDNVNDNSRFKIADNIIYGGTNSSNGIGAYSAVNSDILNNKVEGCVRAGLDVRPFSASIGNHDGVTIIGNKVTKCGWNIRIGNDSATGTAFTLKDLVFKDNYVADSSYGINLISNNTASGLHDVVYRAVTGGSCKYSVGDIVVDDPTDVSTPSGKITHRYVSVAGAPSSATLVDLY